MAAPRKIVLIEDDAHLREAIGRALDASGIDNVLYASAEALLSEGRPAESTCVVCDLELPGISGLDLLDSFRAQGGWPPLILITAFDAPGLRGEAARRGAAAYLVKPFPLAQLLSAIARATR